MNEFEQLARTLAQTKGRLSVAERRMGNGRKATRSPWKAGTLAGTWTNRPNCEPFGYAVDNDRYLHLKGVLQGPSTNPAVILPEGMRPASDRLFIVAASGGAALALAYADGNIFLQNVGTSNISGWVSLSGVMLPLDDYHQHDVLIGSNDTIGDYTANHPVPCTRLHLGGQVIASGYGRTFAAPAAMEEVFHLSNSHGSVWRYKFQVVGSDTVGLNPIRIDIEKTLGEWISGSAASYFSLAGITWPSVRMYATRQTISLPTNMQNDSERLDNWTPVTSVFTDDMGMCWLCAALSMGVYTAGTTLFTLPAGSRPNYDLLVPAISTETYCPVRITAGGDVKLEAAATSEYLMIAHPFWPDN